MFNENENINFSCRPESSTLTNKGECIRGLDQENYVLEQEEKELLTIIKYNCNLSHRLGKLEAQREMQANRYNQMKRVYGSKFEEEENKKKELTNEHAYLLELVSYYREKAINYKGLLSEGLTSEG